jgi:hypothetical protein
VMAYVEEDNERSRQDSLDALEEEWDFAIARSTIYQQDLRRYHSRRVRSRTFQKGYLVLRLIQDQAGMHKLSPPWVGPFVISRNLNNGSYYLVDIREHEKSTTSEEETKRPGNIAHLKPYYTWSHWLILMYIPLYIFMINDNKAGIPETRASVVSSNILCMSLYSLITGHLGASNSLSLAISIPLDPTYAIISHG